jgi:hypothetical protein
MASYLINKSSSSAIEDKIPYEVWMKRTTNYSKLKTFECPAYCYINNGKLESRAKQGIFVGYRIGVKDYRTFDIESSKVIHSHDVGEACLMQN